MVKLVPLLTYGTVITTGDQVPAGAFGFNDAQVAGAAAALQL
jgi:hypothetical protein